MRKLIAVCVTMGIVLSLSAPVLAEDFYDKGRNNTYVINGTSTGYDTAVMSAGALFGPTMNGTGGNGKEQIRFWTRTENVRAYYNSIWGGGYHNASNVYAVRVDHRLYTQDSRRTNQTIDRQNVLPAAQGAASMPPILDQIVDYLNFYPGYPAGSVLKALFNAAQVSSVEQYTTSDNRYDWTVSIRAAGGLSKVVTDLPSSVSYSAADAWASDQANLNQASSIGATFPYTLVTGSNAGYNYCLWPQGNMAYNVDEWVGPTLYPHIYWSGTIGISHYVNSNSGYSAPPCP